MLVIVLAACACGSTLLWGALVLRGRRRGMRNSAAPESEAARLLRSVGAEVLEVHRAVTATREEDRVRAAIDPTGAPTWVDAEDLFWHEIVCWPPRRNAPDVREQPRKSSAQGQ